MEQLKKRKRQTKVVDGITWVRYEGDQFWVAEPKQ